MDFLKTDTKLVNMLSVDVADVVETYHAWMKKHGHDVGGPPNGDRIYGACPFHSHLAGSTVYCFTLFKDTGWGHCFSSHCSINAPPEDVMLAMWETYNVPIVGTDVSRPHTHGGSTMRWAPALPPAPRLAIGYPERPPLFTFWTRIRGVGQTPRHVTLHQVISVLNGEEPFTRARWEQFEAERIVKADLPAVQFIGLSNGLRGNTSIVPTGCVVLDVDDLELNGRTADAEMRRFIESDWDVVLAFVSPSGDGIKVVVRIPDWLWEFRGEWETIKDWAFEQWGDDPCLHEALKKNQLNMERQCFMRCDGRLLVGERYL